MSGASQLAAALASLQRGDVPAALVALLDAWRACRAPRLATLVEDVSERAARARPAITGKTLAALDAQWREIEAAGDPADVRRLVASLPKGTSASVRERIAMLRRRDDPRVAWRLVELLREPGARWCTGSWLATWSELLELLASSHDPRVREALQAIPWIRDEHRRTPFDGGALQERIVTAARQAATAIVVPAALNADERATCDAIEAALAPGECHGAALLARIYADPDDLELRRVYADWLLERQDPRGELINLQLARPLDGKPTKREQTLVKLHAHEWSGALGANLQRARFERGFLHEVHLKQVVEDPVLSTVVELHCPLDTPAAGAALLHPQWVSLREVRVLSRTALDGMLSAARHPLRFTEIALESNLFAPPPDLSALPALRVFELAYHGEVSEQQAVRFLEAPVFHRLDTIALLNPWWEQMWVAAFSSTQTHALELRHQTHALRLERDPEPRLTLVMGEHARGGKTYPVLMLASWWPRDRIPRVRAIIDASWDRHPKDREALLEAVRALDPEATLTSA